MNDYKKSGNFRRNNKRSEGDRPQRFGGSRFGDRRGGSGRGFGKRPDMHKATCSNCGKLCEVPFKPTGDKPIYCNDCFGKTDNSRNHRDKQNYKEQPFVKREEVRNDLSPEIKIMLMDINLKLDRLLASIEASTVSKIQKPEKVKVKKEVKKVPVKKTIKRKKA